MKKYNHGDVIVSKRTGKVGIYRIDKTPKGRDVCWWYGDPYGMASSYDDLEVLCNIAEYNPQQIIGIQNADTFEVKNKLIITDPCYDVGTWCSQSFNFNVKPGMWQGRIAESDDDKRFLLVHHVDNPTVLGHFSAKRFAGELGVDSGTIGVFNRWVERIEYGAMLEEGVFPERDNEVAAFSFGCFASTTNGDGTQQYKCLKDNGAIYAVLVSLD